MTERVQADHSSRATDHTEDVAAHAASVELLTRREEQYAQILETITDGLVLSDLEGRYLFANSAAARIFGAPREQIEGSAPDARPWTVLSIDGMPDSLDKRPSLATARMGTPVRGVEVRIRRPDGSEVVVLTNTEIVRNSSGAIGVLSVLTDITPQKDAEAAFRASEEQYRSVIEASVDGIAVASLEGVIQVANPQFARLFGYDFPDSVVGRRALKFVAPAQRERAVQEFRRTIIQGRAANVALQFVRRDGSTFPGEISASVIRDDAGTAVAITAVVRDITERALYEERLRHQATHDALTGLPNRTLFLDRLHIALGMARRKGEPLCVLLIDLDRFKEVNDTLGHHIGDMLLSRLGSQFAEILRASDTVARLGGDEFGIMLPDTDRDGAEYVATKLLKGLETPMQVADHQVYQGASLGIVVFPDDGEDGSSLLRRADVAMYGAKRRGGGYAWYDAEGDPHSPERLELVADLRRALDARAISVVYQPQVELSTGRVTGLEGLARWIHPVHGHIGPEQFIPLAEETGLIKLLTAQVMDDAVREASRWHEAGFELPVAVNVSSWTLHDRDFPAMVRDTLRRYNMPPRMLCLELTESALMIDRERARSILLRLRDMGVRISIDDFGTGYSSLVYLERLPVDEVKIDGPFVRDLTSDESEATIVRSILDLGHNLGLDVVAEGVETGQIEMILARMGCDRGQGYAISPPLDAREVQDFLRDRSAFLLGPLFAGLHTAQLKGT